MEPKLPIIRPDYFAPPLAETLRVVSWIGMRTLHDKPVLVLGSDGTPIAFGRFFLVEGHLPNQPAHVELAFETDIMSCRVRIHEKSVSAIKATWDGATFKYVLPTKESVWVGTSSSVPPKREGRFAQPG